jgi:hypothetical protein
MNSKKTPLELFVFMVETDFCDFLNLFLLEIKKK